MPGTLEREVIGMTMENRQFIRRITGWIAGPAPVERGVAKMTAPKFFLVLLLYIGALIVFARDPFFQNNGIFVYRQGIVTVFFAFVLTASLNWEMLLFGRVSGGNLLLQLMQLPPLTLLLARLTSFPSEPLGPVSIREKFFQFLHSLDKETFNFAACVPDWLGDLFGNWRISLCFMLILFFLSFRNLQLKLGLLISVLVILFGSALNAGGLSVFLIGGTLLLIAGYALQFCRYDRVIFFENAVRRIARSGPCDSKLSSVMLSAVTAFYETGKVSRPQLMELVRSVYADQYPLQGNDLQLIAAEVVRKMVYQYGLAEVHSSSDGEFLAPNPMLFRYDNLLGLAAVAPRLLMTASFAILWILLPIDLVPDGIPLLGVLDDAAVALISGFALQKALPAVRSSSSEKTHSISQS